YAPLVLSTRSACIIRKQAFSVGGITGCFRFRRTAACASMRSLQAKRSLRFALTRALSAKCEKAKSLPITLRCGQTLNCRRIERSARDVNYGGEAANSYHRATERAIHLGRYV